MFVLGIDPGVSRCGYSVLERVGARTRPVAIGVLRTSPQEPLPDRLAELAGEIAQLFDEYRPAALALERVLFQVNVRTAMSVGQVSGLCMVEAARRRVPVSEYSPNQVKDAVVGYGSATKEQVQRMVQTILGLAAPPRPADAADAAAVALCHLSHAALIGATR
ncbi:MAG: crossover junction endodeoxyribonuclease RuvC [Acidimicrobiia bacterium]